MGEFKWDIDLSKLRGLKVRIETHDGVLRNGTFDAVETKVIEILNRQAHLPTAIVIGGDSIPVNRIRRIKLV